MFNTSDFLNPIRHIRMSFVVGEWVMRLLSASVEAFLRFNFGRRYMRMLFGAFFFFLFYSGINPVSTLPTILFLHGLLFMVIRHLIYVFRRRGLSVPEPHSDSSGDSWTIWQQHGLQRSTVQRIIEPAVCGAAGFIIFQIDQYLGLWLGVAAISLFVKEQISYAQLMRRVIEANDAKVAAQNLNNALKQFQQGAGQTAQKPQRARFPVSGHRPRP